MALMAKKVRLDQLIVQRGLAETRSRAQALIMAGSVRVAGAAHSKPGDMVPLEPEVELLGGMPYASRGGYKLAHALDAFGLSPAGLTAIDAGASTGGFTDVLLQRGAARVYAVDVGYGLLDWRLRQDARVVVVERTNVRYLDALPAVEGEQAPRSVDCATVDVAFISLRLVLPVLQRLVRPDGWMVALIKPQFEAGAAEVDRGGGVVRNPAVHRAVLRDMLGFVESIGLAAHGLVRSPITGPAGNVEFLVWLGGDGPLIDRERAIEQAMAA
jgi:23S rRNA (cytidine1920-2'-O)/16S rRNA (cytidine1409-2'-O)-methyltransferase